MKRFAGCQSCLVLVLVLAAGMIAAPLPAADPLSGQPSNETSAAQAVGQAGDARLTAAIALAKLTLARIEADVRDYSAVLIKRERIDGELGPYMYLFMKLRHEQRQDDRLVAPFSVYMHFLAPAEFKGREVIYAAGKNGGKLLAHDAPNSITGALFGTVALDPGGMLAMKGNRHPIMQVGISNLARRVLSALQKQQRHDEYELKILENAKVNGRVATVIEVVHPNRREHFQFHIWRVYIDDELQLPIRFEAYDWPASAKTPPVLLEEYTYVRLKLNNGFTNADFERENPDYGF